MPAVIPKLTKGEGYSRASIWFEIEGCRGSWFENWGAVGPKNSTD